MSKHGDVVAKMQCPSCAKRNNDKSGDNLAIFESGYAKCFRSDCSYYDYKKHDKNKKVEKKPLAPLAQGITYSPLKSRGIHKKTCEAFGYGVLLENGQPLHVMKYGNESQKFRTRDKKFFWRGDRSGMIRFFGQELYNKGKSLVITEGELDCLSVAQVRGTKWPCVSLPNGADSVELTFKNNIEWLKGFDEIVLFFDDDEAGRSALLIAEQILPGRCKKAVYPAGYNDANEMLVAGMTKEIENCYWNAKPIAEDKGYRKLSNFSYKELIQKTPKGEDMEFPGLSGLIGGLCKGKVYGYAAGTGCGKSTLLKQVCHYSAKNYGTKWALMEYEEENNLTALSMLAYEAGVNVEDVESEPELITEEAYDKGVKLLGDTITIVTHPNEIKYDDLINRMEALVKNEGVEHIILDNVGIAALSSNESDERKNIDNLMKEIMALKDRTGVSIHVVMQLKNLPDGKDWTDGVIPKKSHLRGSGAIAMYLNFLFTLSRDVSHEDDEEKWSTYLHIQKARGKGKALGKCSDRLLFNDSTGRLDPVEKMPDCPHGKPKGYKKTIKNVPFEPIQKQLKVG